MATRAKITRKHPSGKLYTMEILRSLSRSQVTADMVEPDSVNWPKVTVHADGLDGESTTTEVPAPMAKMVDSAWVAATPEDIAEHTAAIEAAARAVQMAAMEATAAKIGPIIEPLHARLVTLGYDLPLPEPMTSQSLTAVLAARSVSATPDERIAINTVSALYGVLLNLGMTDEQIAGTWEYMEATK